MLNEEAKVLAHNEVDVEFKLMAIKNANMTMKIYNLYGNWLFGSLILGTNSQIFH